ncbi:MAG: S8 family serine peptidase [Actinobacteria bacterium]|nr:S8 family serine peptidase [Actinomycetota bacterium]
MPGRPRIRVPLLVAALSILGLAAPVAGSAAAEPLSPELARLSRPALGAAPPGVQAKALGLPAEGPGSLIREGGRVVVEAHFETGAQAAVDELEAAGADVLLASGRYQTVAAAIAPADLGALAEVPGLLSVLPARAPIVYAVGGATTAASASGSSCEGGSVISEAVGQLNVTGARAAFGARGAGETIGVLSDSFDTATQAVFGGGAVATHAAQDEATGDLPGPGGSCAGRQAPVDVLAEGPSNGTDEGRAMLQAVHDLAPHASLAFATAYSSELEFAHNIELLAEPVSAGGAGADVIVDDVAYQAEPFFQDGIVAEAIRRVVKKGVTYLTAAGNQNVFDASGHEIGSWEAPEFRAMSCPAAIQGLGAKAPPKCMDFDPGPIEDATFGITVPAGETLSLDLQWAEPWFGVEADLNAYLLSESGSAVLVDDPYLNYKSGPGAVPVPFEMPEWTNESGVPQVVQLVIGRCSGTCDSQASATLKPRLKIVFGADGEGFSEIEYPQSEGGDVVGPTIFGHAASAAAISVGAVFYKRSASTPTEPERYSSRGPAIHYFGPVASSVPAAALPTVEELQKPNIIATDCASNTFFGNLFSGGWHFCGTSQAAPHAAAVAALMQQTEPLASPAGIVGAMEAAATPFTVVNTRAAVGAGLLNAQGAIEALGGAAVDDPLAAAPPSPPAEEPTAVPEERQSAASPTGQTAPAGETAAAPTGEAAKAPLARIVTHPGKRVKARRGTVRLTFRFAADQPGATFLCEWTRGRTAPCAAKVTRSFTTGPHRVMVRARDAAGLVGEPTAFRFRVVRVGAAGRRG